MNLCRLFCGLVLSVCLAAPAGAEIVDSVNVETTEFDLPNGLHVILSEDHTQPTVVVNIMYKVGSANETRGRTGFAHLFEHLMFCCGSGHVGKGQFDRMLENVGGYNNAYTMEDFTDYHIMASSNALPLALYLESDRMGYFIDNLRPDIVDAQRDVVKNEIRQDFLDKSYHSAMLVIPSLLYPAGHPYSWPVSGTMKDLSAAQYEDVVRFYKEHYVPGNASLAIVGDFDTAETKQLVEHWFSDVPKGKNPPDLSVNSSAEIAGVIKKTITDKVELPMRRIVWHTPAEFEDGDAACKVLAQVFAWSGYSRLNKRLVYDKKIAISIGALQISRKLGSEFAITFMPRPGHTLDEVQAVIDEEIARISQEPPSQEEIDLAVNRIKRDFYQRTEDIFTLADSLNHYYWFVGQANYFNQDLERYSRVTPQDVSACAKRYLLPDKRVELTVIPDTLSSSRDGAEKQTGEEAEP